MAKNPKRRAPTPQRAPVAKRKVQKAATPPPKRKPKRKAAPPVAPPNIVRDGER